MHYVVHVNVFVQYIPTYDAFGYTVDTLYEFALLSNAYEVHVCELI